MCDCTYWVDEEGGREGGREGRRGGGCLKNGGVTMERATGGSSMMPSSNHLIA